MGAIAPSSINLTPFSDTREESRLGDVIQVLNKNVGPVSLLTVPVFATDHFACWQGTPRAFTPGHPLHLVRTGKREYALCHHVTIPGVPNGGKDLTEASILEVAQVVGTVYSTAAWTLKGSIATSAAT